MHPDLHVISVALNEEEPRYKTKTFVPQNDKWRQNLKGYLTAIGLCLAITLFSRTFLLALDKANLVYSLFIRRCSYRAIFLVVALLFLLL
ncbi:sensor protein KdpD [Proteus mirabilis]|uniref:Sensor protein KdpD n=1 Tax=Proteus mirabilis TaxID=584 RepID=A0A2X2BJW2_PROMI|nr:sensor protein KdpD [Proteus mirabilis]